MIAEQIAEVITEQIADEQWEEIEMWLTGIKQTLEHRCYSPRNMHAVRGMVRRVRRHLSSIDDCLYVLEEFELQGADG